MSVKLPFLALSRRTGNGSTPAECAEIPDCAIAFTTLVDAGSYLQAIQSPEYELELIFRQSLAKYLDKLEGSGIRGVAFDGARAVTLAELREMFGL